MSGEGKPKEESNGLLDYFMIVGSDPTSKTKSQLTFHYPDQFKDKTIPDTVPRFCFPEEELTLQGYDESRDTIVEEFSFILTVLDASKRFGFCRRYLKSKKPDFKPFCYVIVSYWSSFSLFQQVIDVIDLLPPDNDVVVSFLKLLLSKPFPARGDTVAVELSMKDQEKSNTFRFTRSSNPYEYLDYVSFEPLFKTCSVKTILLLFISLLGEQHIIGTGKTLPLITSCMNALTSLIYPFAWQHVFIPILPKQLIEFVEAPMPFLIGMLSDVAPLLNEREMEESTVVIDFEEGNFIRPPSLAKEDFLPPTMYASLRRNLSKLKTSEFRGQTFNQLVAHIFLRFWVDVFANYKNFFGPEHSFDVPKFIKNRPKALWPFLQTFEQTQMFFMFIEEQEQLSKDSKLGQCILVQETQSSIRKKLEVLKPKRTKINFPTELPSTTATTGNKQTRSSRGGQLSDKPDKLTSRRKNYKKESSGGSVASLKVAGKSKLVKTEPTLSEEATESESGKSSRIYMGFGNDKDGQILKSFRDCQTILRSLDHKDFVIYLPILKIRFPEIDKYISSQESINLIPLQTGPLHCFLRFIILDHIDLAGLKVEEIFDLLQFCGDGVPRLRSNCVNQIRQGLNEKNCIEYMKHVVDMKSTSRDIKRVVEEIKLFFVKHWGQLVFAPELETMPNPFLVDLMRLVGHTTIQHKTTTLSKNEENEIRKDNLKEASLKLYHSHVTADYILTVGDKEIPIHRYVLHANAPGNRLPLSEDDDGIDLTPDLRSFQLFIKFIYVLEFDDDPISLDEAHLLWETASFFLEEKSAFEEALCAWMVSGLHTKSVFKVLMQMEDRPYAEVLKEAVLDYVASNMNVLAKHTQLHHLPKPVLISIIQKLN